MGLNAVQTLIPWFMMEPTPGAFVTDGFVDIVRFANLCVASAAPAGAFAAGFHVAGGHPGFQLPVAMPACGLAGPTLVMVRI